MLAGRIAATVTGTGWVPQPCMHMPLTSSRPLVLDAVGDQHRLADWLR
jgi:hypothetical protein